MLVCENPPFLIGFEPAKGFEFMVREMDFAVSLIVFPAPLHRIKRRVKRRRTTRLLYVFVPVFHVSHSVSGCLALVFC